MHLKLDPRMKVADLTVAKQQMVEIAKALSFNSSVLIMDEPTAALTDTEIDELFRIIRQLRDKGVGIVHISHRLEELKQISDRITVMRDGRYIDTVNTADVTLDQIISMMVGRTIYEAAPEVPEAPTGGDRAGSAAPQPGQRASRMSASPSSAGEILGFAGLIGAGRTEVARAIFGADPLDSGEVLRRRRRQCRSSRRATPCSTAIGYLSEDRKRYGLALKMDVESNIVLAAFRKFLGALGWVNTSATRATAQKYVEMLAIKTPEPAAEGQEPFGRQPAEGDHRQVADGRHRRPDLRRADPRH